MWVKTASASEIEEGKPRTVVVNGKEIAIFKSGGRFYALGNICPHRGGPLGEGHLENGVVTCPWHAWDFDVTTGACRTVSGVKQTTFGVKVQNDDILIDA